MTPLLQTEPNISYPHSDGQPMADNTEQYRWIVIIKENLEILFAAVANVFIAGDLFWYPVQGKNKIKNAPDVMVIFGRPRGKRLSYRQWEEGNIGPQVTFEIRSPSNTAKEIRDKFEFYQQHGVEEYYLYDPETLALQGWRRQGQQLEAIPKMDGWVSPRLGIRFVMAKEDLEIYGPDGRKFLTSVELERERQQAEQRVQDAESQLAQEQQLRAQEQQLRAEAEQRVEQERQRVEQLKEQLRALGIDPSKIE